MTLLAVAHAGWSNSPGPTALIGFGRPFSKFETLSLSKFLLEDGIGLKAGYQRCFDGNSLCSMLVAGDVIAWCNDSCMPFEFSKSCNWTKERQEHLRACQLCHVRFNHSKQQRMPGGVALLSCVKFVTCMVQIVLQFPPCCHMVSGKEKGKW